MPALADRYRLVAPDYPGFGYSDTPDPGASTHVIDKNLALLEAVGVTDRRVRFPINVPRSRRPGYGKTRM